MRDRQQVNIGKDQHHTHTQQQKAGEMRLFEFFYVSSSFRATRPIFQCPQPKRGGRESWRPFLQRRLSGRLAAFKRAAYAALQDHLFLRDMYFIAQLNFLPFSFNSRNVNPVVSQQLDAASYSAVVVEPALAVIRNLMLQDHPTNVIDYICERRSRILSDAVREVGRFSQGRVVAHRVSAP